MIAGTALFYPPDWPRRVLEDLRRRPRHLRSVAWRAGAGIGAWLGWTLPGQFAWPRWSWAAWESPSPSTALPSC